MTDETWSNNEPSFNLECVAAAYCETLDVLIWLWPFMPLLWRVGQLGLFMFLETTNQFIFWGWDGTFFLVTWSNMQFDKLPYQFEPPLHVLFFLAQKCSKFELLFILLSSIFYLSNIILALIITYTIAHMIAKGNCWKLLESCNLQVYWLCLGTWYRKAAWLWRFASATARYGSFVMPYFAIKPLGISAKEKLFSSFIIQSNLFCIWMAIPMSRLSKGDIYWANSIKILFNPALFQLVHDVRFVGKMV